ncbi:MAG: cytochrome b561 [Candidatus Tectimicrobiota bacterium]|nr:MAG: cytochrome b561 [Candidatus Tectomicrobia bacterium]
MSQRALPRRTNVLHRLYHWVLHWAETPYGGPALAALAFSEASFFPLPPDPLLLALGLGQPRRALWYALVCSISSVLGGLGGYLIGWGLWEAVGWLFFAYVPGVTPEAFALVGSKYHAYGFWAVFSAGFTPIPYKVFTLAAGVFRLDVGTFLLASALSRTARFGLLGALAWQFGPPVRAFIDRYFNLLSVVFVLLLLLGFAVVRFVL